MIDFEKIDEITMLYIDKDKLGYNTYVQIKNSLQVNDQYGTVKVTMKSEKNREPIDPFDIIIKNMDGKYWIKSDYFEEEGEYYPLSVYEGNDAFILEYKYTDVIMYLHAYYE